jgi:alpha-ketoglutarate-dependent taurine dioxygenase
MSDLTNIGVHKLGIIGAQIDEYLPLEGLSSSQIKTIEALLAKHRVLVFKCQKNLSPENQARFTKQLSMELAPSNSVENRERTHIWRDLKNNPWEVKKAQIGQAGDFMIPSLPEVLVIGQGNIKEHYGITGELGGQRKNYGNSKQNSQVVGGRQFQWHIDGAFYQTHPPAVTSLHCITAPSKQQITYRTSNHEYKYGKGSTGFFCGIRAYENLSDDEKAFASSLRVHYGPTPFERVLGLGMDELGLTVEDDGRDYHVYFDQQKTDKGCVTYPMLWTHPTTGKNALMVHTRCLFQLEDDNGKIFGIKESRDIVSNLVRRTMTPQESVFIEYEEGDLVIWDNLGVWHTATGGLGDGDNRLMHLCSFNRKIAPEYLSSQ